MGIDVIVDSDDLEKLLYVTGCIKQIESAITNQKKDPWAKSAESGFELAHVSLNKAWLNAKRGRDRVLHKPTDYDISQAINIADSGICPDMRNPDFKHLRILGLLEMGNIYQVTKWADTGEVESIPNPVTLIRLSPRGKQIAMEYKMRKEGKFLKDNGSDIDGDFVETGKLLENHLK